MMMKTVNPIETIEESLLKNNHHLIKSKPATPARVRMEKPINSSFFTGLSDKE